MRRAVRLAVLWAGLSPAGCGMAAKPYANDPLLRGGRAVWLSRDAAPPPLPGPPPAVEPPRPTSRPE